MGIKKIEKKETFRTSDGDEFDDEASAEKHETLISAKAAYESARDRYARILWETQITADGQPFKFGLWRNYYFVSEFTDWPFIHSVEFMLSSTYALDEDDALEVKRDRIKVLQAEIDKAQ